MLLHVPLRDLNKGINEFKRVYKHRGNLVMMDDNGVLQNFE
jgi:hypothetical protein